MLAWQVQTDPTFESVHAYGASVSMVTSTEPSGKVSAMTVALRSFEPAAEDVSRGNAWTAGSLADPQTARLTAAAVVTLAELDGDASRALALETQASAGNTVTIRAVAVLAYFTLVAFLWGGALLGRGWPAQRRPGGLTRPSNRCAMADARPSTGNKADLMPTEAVDQCACTRLTNRKKLLTSVSLAEHENAPRSQAAGPLSLVRHHRVDEQVAV